MLKSAPELLTEGKLPVNEQSWQHVLFEEAAAEGLHVAAGKLVDTRMEYQLAVVAAAAETYAYALSHMPMKGGAPRGQPAVFRKKPLLARQFWRR